MKISLLFLLFLPAWSRHDEKVSASEIVVSERELVWTVDVARSWFEEKIKFPAAPLDLSEAQLQSVKDPIARYLRGGLSLEINGNAVEPEIGALRPEYMVFPFSPIQEQYIARMKLEFRFASPDPIERIRLGIRFFEDQTKEHRALVGIVWEAKVYEFAPIGPAEISLARPSAWALFRSGMIQAYLRVDTIAFLLALLVAAKSGTESFRIAASVLLAASLAFHLSTFKQLQFSVRILPSLAAASVVYVALENFWLRDGNARWILGFVLGLVHGLNFGRSLMEQDEKGAAAVWLVHAGILAGLASLLLVACPILFALRRSADQMAAERRRIGLLRVGSALALMVGAALVAIRLHAGWGRP